MADRDIPSEALYSDALSTCAAAAGVRGAAKLDALSQAQGQTSSGGAYLQQSRIIVSTSTVFSLC